MRSTPAGAATAVVVIGTTSTTSAASGATAALPPAAREDSTQSSATVSESTAMPIRSLTLEGLPKAIMVSILVPGAGPVPASTRIPTDGMAEGFKGLRTMETIDRASS